MTTSKQSQSGSAQSGAVTMLLGVAGFTAGVGIGQNLWGGASGAGLGLLLGSLLSTRRRVDDLQQSLTALDARQTVLARHLAEASTRAESTPTLPDALQDAPPAPGASESDALAATPPTQTMPSDTGVPAAPAAPASMDAAASSTSGAAPGSAAGGTRPPTPPRPPARPAGPTPFDHAASAIRSFFFGGNTVVRVGLLVLFVGLTLLAKYAADNALFPIEARLASAALIGLGLVGLGYRQRLARPGFGMSLQGGGVAALYLVTFFAFRVYELVPAGLAFGLFVVLAAATALLSVLQRSEPLLVIGSLGGFLAPVLASTGEGNHVALFSYYLLLNVSIVAVAWRQTWRIPALVAFVCTYGVASTWGVLRYEPELFESTEPFVIAFMVLFTSVAVLHAWQKPPQLRGPIDGTLIFGTPFVSILLEAALVRDFELGLALSAAGFGLFYAAWTVFVWRKGGRELRPLAEAFLALAVGFATMAIPFAFDEALTTSVAWALEGAGLYWIGARQSRALPRAAGVALQGLAAAAFYTSMVFHRIDSSEFMPIANGRALSCLSLAMAGFFMAQQAWRKRESLRSEETAFLQGLGVWALFWWTVGSLAEINQFVESAYRPSTILVWIAATALALEFGGARVGWTPGRTMSLAALPGAALIGLAALDFMPHLLADGGWIAWPFVFITFYVLWARQTGAPAQLQTAFRAGSLWLLALVAAFASWGLVDVGFELSNDWSVAAFGAAVAVVLLRNLDRHEATRAPFDRESDSGLRIGLAPIAGFAALTILGIQLAARGDASPIPHFPLLNPIDVTVAFLGLVIFVTARRIVASTADSIPPELRRFGVVVCVAIAFAALNGMLARVVHQWTDAGFSLDELWNSVAMQVVLSIAWTLVGLAGMLLSSRRGWRVAWMGFAALLAVVVVKLFTVDLSQLSTVARIGTFLAVGALLLVVGYVSPVPPSAGGDETEYPDPTPERATEEALPMGDPS